MMRRRHFLHTTAAAALTAVLTPSAIQLARRWRGDPVPDILAYIDRQMVPAAAAQAAAANADELGKLGDGDIFWSVMWPYMYAVGKAEGTVENALGIDPYQVIYTYDSFSDFSDHPRRAHPILDAHGRPTGKVSDAAGWPQFISTTWDLTVQANDFWYDGPAFGPANQDLGFLYLHRDTGAHAALMAGVTVDPLTQHLTVAHSAFVQAIGAGQSGVGQLARCQYRRGNRTAHQAPMVALDAVSVGPLEADGLSAADCSSHWR